MGSSSGVGQTTVTPWSIESDPYGFSVFDQSFAVVDDLPSLKALLQEHQTEIRSFGVRRLGVFGSFAKGAQRADSDVDLLVEFEEGAKNIDNFVGLALLLEDTMGRRVDLLTPESLSPYMSQRILREMQYVTDAA